MSSEARYMYLLKTIETSHKSFVFIFIICTGSVSIHIADARSTMRSFSEALDKHEVACFFSFLPTAQVICSRLRHFDVTITLR